MTEGAERVTAVPPQLASALTRAAEDFAGEIVGPPVVGWHGRTVGAEVQRRTGERQWLRVVVARPELARGEWWTGNVDASALQGVRRPSLVGWREWGDGAACIRAELMELLPGRACSRTPELRYGLDLDQTWWRDLETSLAAVARHPTERESTTAASIAHRCHVLFGARIDATRVEWCTSHGDLHWANLIAPDFALVDWEGWGAAPAGSDVAGLYLHSLLVPDVADEIVARFPDVFTSPSGRVGLILHAVRMLARAMAGEYPDLIDPIHEAVRRYGPSR